ncbi:formate-dependent nitrite reductase complex subunit NrfG [Variibacter gotjawalensis]|uniref:Formate-dependent nitrite reductase complex subunit NrfG n=1 Tax=Variibacter gotjawalensis TaxID=1333996 RepID=A0A0S3PZ38_9BRAD|nr:c-type cytochrome biogenesis protein CcmI [Variibacter gotjawalensis]NIK47047.1 cytochrome c-type biogenesis protein CcmH [Variibacter gotjawalensis]RZS48952.1 cytochrome c-type biogenesis protein CcmH [Variibacter gotjawalensis]BAT61210.1 formate-dependent nitrite reductase complex subunit NrfG [Variibacter gotjawalensis]
MSLWFVLALMTLVAVAAVLWPLGRRRALAGGSDLAVYRDQLAEIDRDKGAGIIPASEAEAARTEVARRLIAASSKDGPAEYAASSAGGRRIAAVVALLIVPIAAVALYAKLGSPALPSQPLAARLSVPVEQRSIETLIAEVEARVEANPDEARGWEVLAPVYLRLGRYDDLVKARRAILRISGPNAGNEADLGEALVYLANGMVTVEAREAFQRALGLDAKEVKARYFMGIAYEQDGKPQDALKTWQALVADAPADAPWLPVVQRAIARIAPEGPTAEQMADSEQMPPEQRTAMVRGMVERLASRLAQDGGDEQSWFRLIRAYIVLNEPDNARKAAGDARKAANGDAARLKRIDDFVKSLGLET